MTTRSLMTRTSLVLLLAFSAAGCGGSASEPAAGDGVGKEFAAKAVAACASAQRSKSAWKQFPVSSFDPRKPDARKLPEVGTWLDEQVRPTFGAWLSSLEALGEPPTGQAAWTQVLSLVSKIDSLNTAQIQAAKAGDGRAFADATASLQQVQPKLEKATKDAGVAKCAEVHAG